MHLSYDVHRLLNQLLENGNNVMCKRIDVKKIKILIGDKSRFCVRVIELTL